MKKSSTLAIQRKHKRSKELKAVEKEQGFNILKRNYPVPNCDFYPVYGIIHCIESERIIYISPLKLDDLKNLYRMLGDVITDSVTDSKGGDQ